MAIFCKRGHLLSETRKAFPDGTTYCSLCKSIRFQEHKKNKPDFYKNWRYKQRYGITIEEVKALLEKQNYCCAICLSNNWGAKGPQVDHCHLTKKVRGLLCHGCNTAIGLLNEDPIRFKQAIDYLDATR